MTDILSSVLAIARRLRVEPYLVGGPVRDLLMGQPCQDWDIATRRAQQVASAVSRQLHGKCITLDEQYRIYRVLLPGGTLDFAELQGGTIEADLGRRDFTINAMAMPLSLDRLPEGARIATGIIDPFGGQRDIKRKVVRAVSRQAFIDDPLRLLRAFRFSAQFGFAIDRQTRRWIQTTASRFRAAVAAERIRAELLRLLSQPYASAAVRAMDRFGLLKAIFPEMEPCRRTALSFYGRGGVLKHALQTVENLEWIDRQIDTIFKQVAGPLRAYVNQAIGGFPRRAWLKLGGYLHDIGKPATVQKIGGRLRFFGHEDVGAGLAARLMERLRYSRQEVQTVRSWVRNHMRPGNLAAAPRVTDKAVVRFFRDLGDEGPGMLLISLADHFTYLSPRQRSGGRDPVEKVVRAMMEAYYIRREKVIPPRIVDGHVLMRQLHLQSGPLIGQLLEAIQEAQAEGKVRTREEALIFAKKKTKSLTRPLSS